MRTLVKLIFLLNLLDAGLTIYFIEKGLAVEANPFLNFFYGQTVWAFLTVKFSILAACLYVLVKSKAAKIGLWIALMLSLGVVGYSIIGGFLM